MQPRSTNWIRNIPPEDRPLPTGTFLASVRNGAVQFPPALKLWCESARWDLFRVEAETPHRLALHPVPPDERTADVPLGFESSFDSDGKLWIPAELRQQVGLGEQSVMIRIEEGVIRIFLRKVFETLGFGP